MTRSKSGDLHPYDPKIDKTFHKLSKSVAVHDKVCRNLPHNGTVKAKIDKPKCSSPRDKTSGVATNVYLRKILEKPKRAVWEF